MVFTEDDIGNTGKLKREVSQEAVKIARRENPTLFEYFEQVCDTSGQDPQTEIGDMVVRAIHSDDYADAVFDEVVDLSQLNKDQMRKEDAEMVQDLMEALGLDEDESDDPVETLIEQRFEAATNGPMGFMGEQQQQPQQGAGQPQQAGPDPEKQQLRQRVRELEQMVQEDQQQQQRNVTVDESSDGQKKDIDELFGDGSSETEPEPEQDVTEEQQGSGDDQSIGELFGEESEEDDDFLEESEDEDFVTEDTGEVEEITNDAWAIEEDEQEDPISSEDATEQ